MCTLNRVLTHVTILIISVVEACFAILRRQAVAIDYRSEGTFERHINQMQILLEGLHFGSF